MMGRAKGESPLALRMMMTPKSDNSDEEGIAEGNNEALEQEAETVADQPNLETVEPHVQQELCCLAISGEIPTILPGCTQ